MLGGVLRQVGDASHVARKGLIVLRLQRAGRGLGGWKHDQFENCCHSNCPLSPEVGIEADVSGGRIRVNELTPS